MCTGCTAALIESYTLHDPPLVNIQAAYYRDNEVIVDYVLAGRVPVDGKETIRYDRYWALLKYETENLHKGKKYNIHRETLNPSEIIGWEKINVCDLSSKITISNNGIYSQSEYEAYINAIPEADLPLIVFLLSKDAAFPLPHIDGNYLSVVYMDPKTHNRTIINGEPRSSYMPSKNVGKLIIRMPFTMVFDCTLAVLCAYAHCEW